MAWAVFYLAPQKRTEERSPVWGVEACVYAKGFGLSLDDKDDNGE